MTDCHQKNEKPPFKRFSGLFSKSETKYVHIIAKKYLNGQTGLV